MIRKGGKSNNKVVLMLHTQEVTGSNPVCPTLQINPVGSKHPDRQVGEVTGSN